MSASDPAGAEMIAIADAGDPPALHDEAAARRALGQRRMLANGLLLGMGGAFAATFLEQPPGPLVAFLRSGTEAGIVGGLADWFAVTALFRRPLGLPIPHTAVLPRSKERIGRALATFIEQSFLTEAVVLPRLRAARPAHRLAEWLGAPENARRVAGPVLGVLPDVLRVLDDPETRGFVTRVLSEELREIDLAPLAGYGLQVLTQSGEADVMFEMATSAALGWLQANRAEIERLVDEHSRWWIPRAVNRRIAQQIYAAVTELLTELRRPGTETRAKFEAALDGLIERLLSSQEQAAELNAARDRLLAHPELQAWVGAVWTQISAALSRDLGEPESRIREILEHAVLSFGRALATDAGMQAKLDDGLERALVQALSHRASLASLMTDVVRNWDAETITERFELVIGGDLQYIRMNGTIVGATVGFALHILTHLGL